MVPFFFGTFINWKKVKCIFGFSKISICKKFFDGGAINGKTIHKGRNQGKID